MSCNGPATGPEFIPVSDLLSIEIIVTMKKQSFFQPQVILNQPAKAYPYLCKVVLEVFLCVKIQLMSLKLIVTHVGGYCHIKSFIY